MEKKYNELSFKKNLIWNSIGSFIYLICQWLLTFAVIKFSGTFENAGVLSLAISISNIFFTFSCYNVRPYQVSDVEKKFSDELYFTFRIITCGISIILCIIYILLFKYNINQMICIVMFMVYKTGEAFVDLLHGFEQRKNRMDIGGISLIIRGISSIVSFSIGLILTDNLNVSIAMMIMSTFLLIYLYDYKQGKKFVVLKITFNYSKIKTMALELLPLVVGTMMNTFGATFPRQILENSMGTNNLGIYATVAAPAVIIQVAASYIFNPMQTIFANYKANNQMKEFMQLLKRTSLIIVAFAMVGCLGSVLLGEWGLELLYGTEIAKYTHLLLPVVMFSSLNAYVWFLANVLIVLRKIKAFMWVYLLGLVISLVATIPFIDVFGMNGVTYTMILYSLVVILRMYYIIIKEVQSGVKI